MDDEYFKEEENKTMSVKEELQEQLLENAYEEIANLRLINQTLREEQLQLRDEVALRCYIEIFKDVADAEKSAIDAYRIADIFLRVRETGGVHDDNPNKE